MEGESWPGLWVAWRPSTRRDDADRLLAELVDVHLDGPATIGRRCPRCGSTAHGRPVVRGAQLSLSRAPGLALAALSSVGEVGVDVEPMGRAGFAGFERVALHPGESSADPTLTWVRKEALLKASGRGLAVDPQRVRLDDAGQIASWPDDLPDPALTWNHDLDLPSGYVGSVALISPAPSAEA